MSSEATSHEATGDESTGVPLHRARFLGAVLFAIYCIAYATFVLVAAFGTFKGGAAVGGLSAPAFGGLSIAVVAGFGLIIGAFLLAAIYAMFGAPPRESETEARK